MVTMTQTKRTRVENKRYVPRWNLEARCVLRLNKETTDYEGLIKNLSCSGARIITNQRLTLHQNVNLTIYLSESDVVSVGGTVVWSKIINYQNHIGIHFFDTSSETQDTILQHAVDANKEKLTDYWFNGWEGR